MLTHTEMPSGAQIKQRAACYDQCQLLNSRWKVD